ncbi:NAD-dependent epimerase/dehydratase family protein [Aquisediminimonas profunda]|uniref:NAD-dependent epimerase/dehydratase family protein n=1 Tax=Aquisediminimonas profunda TaxID=1550733 RepID=UPI001C6262AA|nr:NAD-dependent epimerase/dehydratase family protein [Aquisediminimonas profunda]
MRILVTGAGGFVGREISTRLVARGDTVIALDAAAMDVQDGVEPVAGDLGDRSVRREALSQGIDAVIHLATVPGGAAEADPATARRINVDAMYDLLLETSAVKPGLRFVYASSIAVFGDALPDRVDDATPLNPKLIYGGHKAMMEDVVAMMSNRGMIDGVTVRLPGILARPRAASGMKSAFLSDLFHALKAGEPFICPVSSAGRIWAQSVACCANNFVHAVSLDSALMPPNRAVTLPALVVAIGAMAQEIARQTGVDAGLVEYRPEPALEAMFAAQPPLVTPAAEHAGFAHDGDLATLVASALATLQ